MNELKLKVLSLKPTSRKKNYFNVTLENGDKYKLHVNSIISYNIKENHSIENKIINTLNKCMNISSLKIVNESFMHNVPVDAESHFKIIIVSEKFFEIRAVKRHQLIYSVLNEEMQKIHAIAIHPFTPEEWKEKTGESLDSPKCLGGGND